MHLHRDLGEVDYIIGEVAKPLVGFLCPMDDDGKECKGSNNSDMVNLSFESSRFSWDLLDRCMESGSSREKEFMKREEEEGDLELNLGLSLGGRFGVDKGKLVRSSSVASCLPITRDDDALTPPATVYPPLARTSSLPVETEEEWRKRKEVQTLRRMEAKRRRFKKQRNMRAEREAGNGCGSDGAGGGSSGSGSGSGGVEEERRESDMNWRQRLELLAAKKFETSVPSPCRLNKLNAASRQASVGRGIDLEIAQGKGSYAAVGDGSLGGKPLRQGSIEAQGGSLLTISAEWESRPLRGSSSGSDLSPASIQSSQPDTENPSKGTDIARNRSKKTGTNEIRDMPCVFTKGDGPNGRRVDGILYKYGKGEEVKIMCVCHGCFLSPAEFVKHAGLINVSHPLKHIVIVPNPPSF